MKTGLLLSGGVDSTALAWWQHPDIAYTINYGHAAAEAEIRVAGGLCRRLGCKHHVIEVDLAPLGSGPLAGLQPSSLSKHSEWWPFRNQVLCTLAGMHAVQHGIGRLLVGTVITDRRHRDGRPEFLRTLDQLMRQQEGRLRIAAPAIKLDSRTLLHRARLPKEVLLHTHSCHRGNTHCGLCPGCTKRLDLFRALGLTD